MFYPFPWAQQKAISFWAWDGAAAYGLLAVFLSVLIWIPVQTQAFRGLPLWHIVFGSSAIAFIVLETHLGLVNNSDQFILLKSIEEAVLGSTLFDTFSEGGVLVVLFVINPTIACLAGIFCGLALGIERRVAETSTNNLSRDHLL